MGKMFESLQPEHEAFIREQKLFFVGTAPAGMDGHVNISPKGYDCLRVISPSEVAYLDFTGSGNETSAHIKENRRITLMFVAFQGAPMILRLYGKGITVLPGTPEWDRLAPSFETNRPGVRQMIAVKLHGIKTSCGYSVPFCTYEGERDTLNQWAANKGNEALAE